MVPLDSQPGRWSFQLGLPRIPAEGASARYGWPLHVIENCADDPSRDQPQAFLEALRAARNFHRLVEVKKRYDPENLFRVNRNIRVAGS
jgi:hypothetical protein